MQKISILQKQAIQAAKNLNWNNAIEINQQILIENCNNTAALNRLGLAYIQIKNKKEAIKTFKEVIKIDKSNIIANKHLKRIKQKKTATFTAFSSNNYFIEEPGKTKIVGLLRLTSKSVLGKLGVGQPCSMALKNRYISITTEDGKNIGALPDDLSFRLTKLIKRGNEYSCIVHSCDNKSCTVNLKETKTSKKNTNIQSFPSKGTISRNLEDFIIEDDIPVEVDPNEVKQTNLEEALQKIHNKK